MHTNPVVAEVDKPMALVDVLETRPTTTHLTT